MASAITMLWHPTDIAAAALATLCIGLAYAVSGYGYIALSAALAAPIVFFIDISGVAGAATLADQLFATVIGGGLAVIAHALLPDDALVRLRQRAGELLKAEIDYAATVVKAFVNDVDYPAEAPSATWQRAFYSRAAFEAALGATLLESRELRLWLRSYRSGLNAITAACTSLESSLPNRPGALTSEFVAAVDDFVFALRGGSTDPATTRSVDTTALAAMNQRVREAASELPSDSGGARMLVAGVAAITAHLARISPDGSGARL